MGQKVNPIILRIGIIKNWSSTWFAPKKEYADFILEDVKIRKFLKEKLSQAAVAKIDVERLSGKIKIKIFTARPGIVIGRRGADIEKLKTDLQTIVNKDFVIDIVEVKDPAKNAQLIADNISFQLEKRVAFRRAMKRAAEQAMNSGAQGVKIDASGRLGGAEIARRECVKIGKLPRSTLRADIDYGFAESYTTYGLIGIKAWVYHGDILPGVKKETPAEVTETKTKEG